MIIRMPAHALRPARLIDGLALVLLCLLGSFLFFLWRTGDARLSLVLGAAFAAVLTLGVGCLRARTHAKRQAALQRLAHRLYTLEQLALLGKRPYAALVRRAMAAKLPEDTYLCPVRAHPAQALDMHDALHTADRIRAAGKPRALVCANAPWQEPAARYLRALPALDVQLCPTEALAAAAQTHLPPPDADTLADYAQQARALQKKQRAARRPKAGVTVRLAFSGLMLCVFAQFTPLYKYYILSGCVLLAAGALCLLIPEIRRIRKERAQV